MPDVDNPDAVHPDDTPGNGAQTPETSPRLEDLRRRWENDPSSTVYLQLAEECRKFGRLDEAVEVLEQSLEHRPRDPRGRVALARCRLELGEASAAAELLEQVTRQDPAHVVANKLLLEAYLQLSDAEKAAERLNLYRLINDRDPELDHFVYRLERLQNPPGEGHEPTPPDNEPEVFEIELPATPDEEPSGDSLDDAPPMAESPWSEPPAFELEAIETDDEPGPEGDGPPTFDAIEESPRDDDEPAFEAIEESPRDDDEPTFDAIEESPRDDDEPAFEPSLAAAAEDPGFELVPEPEPEETATETTAETLVETDDEPVATVSTDDDAEADDQLFDLAPPPAPDLDDLFGLANLAPAPAPALDSLWGDAETDEEPGPEAAPPDEPDAAEADDHGASEADADADGQDETATVTLGQLYLQQGHFGEAEAIFRDVLARDPEHAAAREGLAEARARSTGETTPDEVPERTTEPSAESLDSAAQSEERPADEEDDEEEDTAVSLAVPVQQVDEEDDEEEDTAVGRAVPIRPTADSVDAAKLLADRTIDTVPEGLTAKKILVLRQYAKHLRQANDDVQ